MKRTLAVAGLLICLLASGCTPVRSLGGSGDASKLRLNSLGASGSGSRLTALSVESTFSAPATLMVYRVVSPLVSTAGVEAQGRRLGIIANARDDGDAILVRDASGMLIVDKATGSFDFSSPPAVSATAVLTRLLSDEEYRVRAEEFLDSAGLMKASAVFDRVSYNDTVSELIDGKWVTRPCIVEVHFKHRPLNGIRFDAGVGPRISVLFGDAGKLIGARSVWRDVEPYKSYPLATVSQAASTTAKGGGIVSGADQGSTGVVDEVEISYMNDPNGMRQEYVVPFFIMEGTSDAGEHFTALTPALAEGLVEYQPVNQFENGSQSTGGSKTKP